MPASGKTLQTARPPCTMAIVAILPDRRPEIFGGETSARQQGGEAW